MNRSRWGTAGLGGVFPTHVGMNRLTLNHADALLRFPYARGDEPLALHLGDSSVGVFPTHVGMNRRCARWAAGQSGFPYARGDEPINNIQFGITTQFSLRTWG